MLIGCIGEAYPQLINFAAFNKLMMRLIVYSTFFLISTAIIGQENLNIIAINDSSVYYEQILENANNELVDIEHFVPGIELDIRFTIKNNTAGEVLYTSPKAFVRKPVAVSMAIIQEALRRRGLGLKIYDAYLPYSVAERVIHQPKNSSDKACFENGIKHSRGASVDVSLISLDSGEEIQMPSGYGQSTEATVTNYQDLPANVIENRSILIEVMQQHGFRVSPNQWWHFDFMGWQAFEVMDLSFEEIENVIKYLE